MRRAYAVATVVNRVAPVSSHLGDRAIIHADGRMVGFVGGSCSRDIVRTQALATLRTGEPRLVRIRHATLESEQQRDTVTILMGCASEGAVDVYIEPHVPKRQLLLAGFTPVADALAQLASPLDFVVTRFVDARELENGSNGMNLQPVESLSEFLNDLEGDVRSRTVAIAASQGHYDERALSAFLQHDLAFVGLLASRKRAESVMEVLQQEGISAERTGRIRSPVGLPIGARKPAEVAVAILAEVIASNEAPAELPLEPRHACCEET